MADYFRKGKSLFSTTSNTFSTGTGVTITPNSVTGLPTDTELVLTFDRVDSGGTATPSKMERIIGTISGGNFVIRTSPSSGRGADGTTDQAHTAPVVEYIPNAKDMNDLVDGLLVEHDQDGTHDATKVMMVAGAQTITGLKTFAPTSTFNVHKGIKDLGTVGATETVNWALADRQKMTLDENLTIDFSNAAEGQTLTLYMLQDGSGTNTIAWTPTIVWQDGITWGTGYYTTTANKMNIAVITYVGSAYYGVISKFA